MDRRRPGAGKQRDSNFDATWRQRIWQALVSHQPSKRTWTSLRMDCRYQDRWDKTGAGRAFCDNSYDTERWRCWVVVAPRARRTGCRQSMGPDASASPVSEGPSMERTAVRHVPEPSSLGRHLERDLHPQVLLYRPRDRV